MDRAPARPAGHPREDWFHLAQTERRDRVGSAGRPRLDGLRAWYTVPHLAALAGVSIKALEALLPAGLIEQRKGPRTMRRVYLSRLVRAEPELYESILERLHAERMAERARDAA